jgi:hypothetical protein
MRRKLHNEEFYYVSTSPNIVRPSTLRRATWAGYVVTKYFIQKSYVTKLLGRLWYKCIENIKNRFIQKSRVFWGVYAMSAGNELHNT